MADARQRKWPTRWLNWKTLLVAVVAMGLLSRFVIYALDFPLWLDEASVGLNLLRPWATFWQPLSHHQVSPPLFLVLERVTGSVAGYSGFALRAVPLLAGLLAVLICYPTCRLFAGRRTALLATALLACSLTTARLACQLKSYSLDLLVTLLLLYLTMTWLNHSRKILYPLLLIVLTPLAIGVSFPSIFVLASALLALGLVFFRAEDRAAKVWLGLLACTVVASFLFDYAISLHGQESHTRRTMQAYWHGAFPPYNARFFLWLLKIQGSEMMTYPLGGKNGIAFAIVALMALGIRRFWMTRRFIPLALLLGPFVFTFLAAVLRRYPYGGAARIEQHLVPSIVILAATGLMALAAMVAALLHHRRVVHLTVGIIGWALVAFAGICTVMDIRHPYYWPGAEVARQTVRQVAAHAGPDAQLVFLTDGYGQADEFQWYVRTDPSSRWSQRIDAKRLQQPDQSAWVLMAMEKPLGQRTIAAELAGDGVHAKITVLSRQNLLPGWPPGVCEVLHVQAQPSYKAN